MSTETTVENTPLFQVKWFSKKKGYGFVKNASGDDIFVHHSDIGVNGFRYLREGELITGSLETMEDGKLKVVGISSPMDGGKLMCEVETANRAPRSS